MPIDIKDPETDRLVRDLASATGETITEASAAQARYSVTTTPGSLPDGH